MLKMLMLKMLMLKKKKKKKKTKQCIAIIYYKTKIESFWQDDTRLATSLIFIVVSQAKQVPKVKKTKRNVIRT